MTRGTWFLSHLDRHGPFRDVAWVSLIARQSQGWIYHGVYLRREPDWHSTTETRLAPPHEKFPLVFVHLHVFASQCMDSCATQLSRGALEFMQGDVLCDHANLTPQTESEQDPR